MAEPQLELRILTGIHAGARVPATAEFLIGADPACEIVLADPGISDRHARILLVGDRWKILPLTGNNSEAVELPSGARVALGEVLISIDAANAPWQEIDQPDLAADGAEPGEADQTGQAGGLDDPAVAGAVARSIAHLASLTLPDHDRARRALTAAGTDGADGADPANTAGATGDSNDPHAPGHPDHGDDSDDSDGHPVLIDPDHPNLRQFTAPLRATRAAQLLHHLARRLTWLAALAAWSRAHRRLSVTLGVCLLIPVLLLGLFAWQDGRLPAPPATAVHLPSAGGAGGAPAPANGPARALPRTPGQDEVERLVRAAALPAARVSPRANGGLLVEGYARTEEDYVALAEQLARIRPRPLLRLQLEDEVRGATRSWNALPENAGIRLAYHGAGRFRLDGVVRDAAAQVAAPQRVHEEFPGLLALDNQLRTWNETATALEARLRGLGLAASASRWHNGRYTLEFRPLLPDELAALESATVRFNRETGGAFPFQISAPRAPGPRPATPGTAPVTLAGKVPSRPLPFEIRSIGGGRTPWLVLSDQRIVLPGGEVAGYRLSRITDTEVIFEGPETVVLPR